jgi:hypothetical protein
LHYRLRYLFEANWISLKIRHERQLGAVRIWRLVSLFVLKGVLIR